MLFEYISRLSTNHVDLLIRVPSQPITLTRYKCYFLKFGQCETYSKLCLGASNMPVLTFIYILFLKTTITFPPVCIYEK